MDELFVNRVINRINASADEYDYTTPTRIASVLKINIKTVRRWYSSRQLKAIKFGKRIVRIQVWELDRFLKKYDGGNSL